MSMNLQNFKLLKEDAESYHVGHPNGRSLKVAKRSLSPVAKAAIEKLRGKPQMASEGVVPQGDEPTAFSNQPDVDALTAAYNPQSVQPESSPTDVPESTFIPPTNAPPVPATGAGAMAGTDAAQYGQPAAPAIAPAVDPLQSNSANTEAILGKQEQDIKNYMAAEQQAGQSQGDAWQAFAKNQAAMLTPNEIAEHYKSNEDTLKQAILDGKVDPQKYWEKKGPYGKLTAGIGIILGGIGAGLAGGQNVVLQQINKSIDDDIEAQKSNQDDNWNLFKMNREALGNAQAANLATQNQMLTGTQAITQQAMAKSSNAQAVFRGNELINQLEQQKQANRLRLGIYQAAQQGSAGSPSQMQPEVAAQQLIQDPKERDKVMGEIADTRQVESIRDMWQKSYDDLNQSVAAGHFSPSDRQSAVESIAGMIEHKTEGRLNRDQALAQANAILPGIEGEDTRVKKLQRGNALFNSLRKTSNMTANYMNPEAFAATSSNAMSRTPQAGILREAQARLRVNPQDAIGLAAMKRLGVQ